MHVTRPSTLAYARFHTGLLHLWRSEPDVVRERALGVLQVGDEAELPIWRAIGTCLLGAASAALGRGDEGAAQVRQGIALYRGLRTPPVFWPLLLSLDAGASAAAGRWADGLPRIDEAIALAASAEGSPVLPELHILRGDLLAQGGGSQADAREAYERAFELATPLGARMSQLRAATRRVRHATDAEDAKTSLGSLGDVYATFSHGLATADLAEARELLERRP